MLYVVFGCAWVPLLMMVHELGHALAAVALTEGEVSVSVRPLSGGRCEYDHNTLRRPGHAAWILAAGPLASLLAGVALALLAMRMHGLSEHLVAIGALGAATHVLVSLVPLRFDSGRGESDGLVLWHVLSKRTPSPGWTEPGPGIRPLSAVLIASALVTGFVLSLGAGLAVAVTVVAGIFLQGLEPR